MKALAGKRVLVVEDEAVIAFALEDVLANLGCEVVGPAVRLMQALELAETATLDAAILDVNINQGRSYSVADELNKRGVPYVFATGYGAEGIDQRYASTLVLTKPYKQEDVHAALVGLLGLSAGQR